MKKGIRLTGNLLHFDQENLNGRIYTKETVEKMVDQFNKLKETGPVLGELGYPENFEVNLVNVSHEIEFVHLNEENKTLVGTIRLLDTPKGKIVQELVKPGHDIGLSCRPRVSGTVNENKEIEDYELFSFDLVSGPDAFGNIKENDYLTLFEDE